MGIQEPSGFALQAKRIAEQLHLLLEQHSSATETDECVDQLKPALMAIEAKLEELARQESVEFAAVP